MSYAATPMLSVDAPQFRVRSFSPRLLQLGAPGVVGAWVSAGGPTRSRSTFGPPLAVVAVTRIVLVPAVTGVVSVLLAQVSQLAVGLKARLAETTVPFTATSAGRLVVVPLAYRITIVPVPAIGALTVH